MTNQNELDIRNKLKSILINNLDDVSEVFTYQGYSFELQWRPVPKLRNSFMIIDCFNPCFTMTRLFESIYEDDYIVEVDEFIDSLLSEIKNIIKQVESVRGGRC